MRWLAAFTLAEIVGPFALLSSAERHLPSSTSGLLVAAVPIFSALLAWLTRSGDRLTPVRWAGLAVGLGGVALLAGPGAGQAGPLPVLEVLGTALGYSIGPLIANRKLAGLPPVAVNTVCLGAAAVLYAPFAALTWPQPPAVDPGPGAPWPRLGVICTAAAFLVFFRLIAEVGPARATVITYVNPAVAVALGVLVLGEPLTVAVGISFALILGGSVLATRPGPGADDATAPPAATGWPGRGRMAAFGMILFLNCPHGPWCLRRHPSTARPGEKASMSQTAAPAAGSSPGLRMSTARGPLGGGRHRAGLGHGGPGRDRGGHRAARHRAGLPHRRDRAAVGGRRLHADAGRAAAARRDARRQLRAAQGCS